MSGVEVMISNDIDSIIVRLLHQDRMKLLIAEFKQKTQSCGDGAVVYKAFVFNYRNFPLAKHVRVVYSLHRPYDIGELPKNY